MRYRYTKYEPDLLGEIDIDDLTSKLSDLLLSSGFGAGWGEPHFDRTLEALHDAILEALFSGGVLPKDLLDRLFTDSPEGRTKDARDRLEALVEQIIDRMRSAGYITTPPDRAASQAERTQGAVPGDVREPDKVTFEVTDKALDFLGYRALRDLLGSTGHSSLGRHDTRDLATGIEASGAPKAYEFGDTLNLDATATLLGAVQRTGDPAEVDYPDLMVARGEYQSSCATVLLLDCSHSMILYGEDRFTPAKRVALALSHLIRTQYPGDSLHAVLFHDSAEEIPVRALGRVRVGPYYTNTREGLRLARRILERQRMDMRQVVMITDGKPSALTQPDGRIYKNAYGLDPLVLTETLAEVAACAKAGIMINTFMLARDYDLMAFVRRVTAMCRGKAYFTTPYTLGEYVLMDYMDKKTRTVH